MIYSATAKGTKNRGALLVASLPSFLPSFVPVQTNRFESEPKLESFLLHCFHSQPQSERERPSDRARATERPSASESPDGLFREGNEGAEERERRRRRRREATFGRPRRERERERERERGKATEEEKRPSRSRIEEDESERGRSRSRTVMDKECRNNERDDPRSRSVLRSFRRPDFLH